MFSIGRPLRMASAAFFVCTARRSLRTKRISRRIIRRSCRSFFGLDGVLYSMPVSDVLTAIVSAVIIAKTYRQLNTAQNVN